MNRLATVRRVDNLISVQVSTPALVQLDRVWPRLPALLARTKRPIAENLATLRRAGIEFIEPEAGLTAFARVGDGDAVSARLEKQGVGVARGSFFEAPEYVRLFLGADPRAFRTGIEALSREVERASRSR